MPTRDLVVVGASAGGIDVLRTLVGDLPPDFPATVVVVVHIPPTGPSALARILDRAGPLSARQVTHEEPLVPGVVLVAPPDHHVVVFDGSLTVARGPRENGHRPAIDVLFRSAARTKGRRVIGVVLSGALDDGSAGMVAITKQGGLGIAQDPADCLHPSMPEAAIAAAPVEHVLPVSKIAAVLDVLVREEVGEETEPPSKLMEVETQMAGHPEQPDPDELSGAPVRYTCPDCQGPLYEIDEGGLTRYRCRVGHAWSVDALIAAQSSALETALWMALRSLDEKAELADQMADRTRRRGHERAAVGFADQAVESRAAADLVRDLIINASPALKTEAESP